MTKSMTTGAIKDSLCKICGHLKSEHTGHIGTDHTGEKINHISCHHSVGKKDSMDMGIFGNVTITHSCSCHGVKPHTYLKRAIKKYQKYHKGLDKTLSVNVYKRKEIQKAIRHLRSEIKENPENKLWWQKQDSWQFGFASSESKV